MRKSRKNIGNWTNMEICYFSIIFLFCYIIFIDKDIFKGYFDQKQDVALGKTDNNQQNDKKYSKIYGNLAFFVISLSFS